MTLQRASVKAAANAPNLNLYHIGTHLNS